MTRPTFPTDITREQFGQVSDLLESARRKTRPRKHDLYDVVCGLFYILRTGSPWRSMPADFPPWRTVHEYFSQWSMRRDGAEPMITEVIKLIGTPDDLEKLQRMSR